MNPFSRMSLRYSLPLLIVGGFAIASLFSYVSAVIQVDKDIELRSEERARTRLSRAQDELEHLLQSGNASGAKSAIASMGALPEIRLAFLTDTGGTVMASTDLGSVGRNWRELTSISPRESDQIADMLGRGAAAAGAAVQTFPDRDETSGVVPVCWSTEQETLRLGQCGAVFYAEEFGREKRGALSRLQARAASDAIATCLIAFLLWLALDAMLGRRVEDVIAVAKRFASGETQARSRLRGNDEIAKLASAVDSMLDEIVRANESVRESEALGTRLGRIVEDSVNEIYVFDSATLRFLQANRGARENLGYSEEELLQLTPVDIKPFFTRESFEEKIRPLREGQRQELRFETVHRRKDGSQYDVEVRLQLSKTERPPVFIAIIQDVTDRKKAEGQLRQAQKMEAVGQLTGGVAHDFNNLLAVVIGNLELLSEELSDRPDLRRRVEAAIAASDRGATLTRSLLAFARKQPLAPAVIDLAHLMEEMSDLLRRALGETIDIEVVRGGGLWKCEVDPGQMQNALLNLALNARDAMPAGGKLTIETANVRLGDDYAANNPEVRPGQYVLLAVTDTGEGMAPAVAARAFDPFFTTKKAGKGSGLGLSMVYGFVKQSDGHVAIYSEPGHGTTVKMYLPRAAESGKKPEGPLMQAVLPAAELMFLIVEDDPNVRRLAVDMVESLGYAVVAAENAEQALASLPSLPRLDVLLTDVVLSGGTNGRELAERVTALRPEIRVLYMSGYTENAVVHDGRLSADAELLQKPFRKQDLVRKIRKILGHTV